MRKPIAALLAALLLFGCAGCMKLGSTPNENPPMRVCTATQPVA